MRVIIIPWIITTVSILLVANFVPGIHVRSLGAAIVAAAILGILNVTVKPILAFFTLPLTVITLGLFLFVLNALVFWLAGSLYSGFRVDSFMPALIASAIVSLISYVLYSVF
jgi:putative membrane protein